MNSTPLPRMSRICPWCAHATVVAFSEEGLARASSAIWRTARASRPTRITNRTETSEVRPIGGEENHQAKLPAYPRRSSSPSGASKSSSMSAKSWVGKARSIPVPQSAIPFSTQQRGTWDNLVRATAYRASRSDRRPDPTIRWKVPTRALARRSTPRSTPPVQSLRGAACGDFFRPPEFEHLKSVDRAR